MKRGIISFLCLLMLAGASAQEAPAAAPAATATAYRETPERINDLVHTKLEVRFDYDKSWMYGKAWVTLQPHFYATDSLRLDAKGMEIKSVSLVNGSKNQPLKYQYDGFNLRIQLNKRYKGGEKYTVYIDYTAKPNDLKLKGSAAINDAKGLYFINSKGEDKNKPTQIWTQGETEATSVWCPTIDRPGQKSTEEISMTVPSQYVSLSNGKLVSQKKNSDGTRTDNWKMELPHAPYLFFMGVGDYAVIKDNYKGKEVSYFVEKQYAPVARKIFGNTPEMMAFFSKITGVEYPWVKYAQITGRDYVSGAMENTTATLHQESAQQDSRELIDENRWEDVIAHELFHHWFGDYVTAESWSNLTLNESFADYSETLWNEFKYGKDAGAATNYTGMTGYLSNPENAAKDLARFHYADKEDMFDAVSYQKGGRVLNMLRNYLGDSAFFKGLNSYLSSNKFKSAEVHNLRLAFEEVSGKDLNWFFDQWYFGSSHPKLDINYSYDDASGKVTVVMQQVQDGEKIFRLPMAIDVYEAGKKTRYSVTMENKTDSFQFSYKKRPDLVNVDAEKALLWEKKDNKSIEQYAYQYKEAGGYVDRLEAIEFAAEQQTQPAAQALLLSALKDQYFGLRMLALGKLDLKNSTVKSAAEKRIAEMAIKDPKTTVRAKAIEMLGSYDNSSYKNIFQQGVSDSSYSVAGASLEALSAIDNDAAVAATKSLLDKPAKSSLVAAIANVSARNGLEDAIPVISTGFDAMNISQIKLDMLQPLSILLAGSKDAATVRKGVDMIAAFRETIPSQYRAQLDPYINDMVLQGIANAKMKEAGPEAKALADYIKTKKADSKKGF